MHRLVLRRIACSVRDLVGNFVRLYAPSVEDGVRVVDKSPRHRDASPVWRRQNFLINDFVIEADGGRLDAGVSEPDAVQLGPTDRSKTHGARLAAGDNLASLEQKSAE